MAFIVKGGIKDFPKPKRFLAIGPGESTIEMLSSPPDLGPDIIIIGLHKVFPLFSNITGRNLDYWTWGDPHGAFEGLLEYHKLDIELRPVIIIPHWLANLEIYTSYGLSSPLTRGSKKDIQLYHSLLKKVEEDGNLTVVQNSVFTKKLSRNNIIFTNPASRFLSDNCYFGTDPYMMPKKGEPYENSLTGTILPICHYLGADEVYCIGFDNMGLGIGDRKVGQEVRFNNVIKEKTKLWTDAWQPYHKMKIYNLSPPKFSPNHTFMETVSIDSILKK
jgi:hypothetical protein